MLKTLRITSWIVAVLVVAFCVFAVVVGLRSDERIEDILKAPGVIEVFKASTDKSSRPAGQASPLEKQAQAFALYLNPPEPTVERSISNAGSRLQPRPTQVAAKFDLFGTCVDSDEPEKSLAFILEPGDGYRWVRQSQQIGHLVVHEIQDGLILLKDGEQITELFITRQNKINVINAHEVGKDGVPVNIKPTSAVDAVSQRPVTVTPAASNPLRQRGLPGRVMPSRPRPAPVLARPIPVKRTKEQMEQTIDFAKKLIEDPESMGISPEEAKKLSGLGEILKDLQGELKNAEQPQD